MSIFKKEKSTVNLSAIKKYYGKIDIDLLSVYDNIIERKDVKTSDLARLFLHRGWEGLLTKTHFNNDKVGTIGTIMDEKTGYINDSAPYDAIIAPVLKFRKPLKDIFKNVQKDEKGRDIVYFSKYPIEKTYKDDIEKSGELTNQKIHYLMETSKKYDYPYDYDFYCKPCSYSVITYNKKEYIKANQVCPKPIFNIANIDYRKIYHYIELKPIKWLCDYGNNRLVCLDGLIAGVPYKYIIYRNKDIKICYFDNFLKDYLLPDLMQFVEFPKLEEVKNEEVKVKNNDIEIKDNVLNMLRGLLKQVEAIKDENDKILIAEDIRVLASIYGKELIKIKNKEKSIYGSTERELIRNGIMPYYVYIEEEIKREVREDNKEQENKEIEMVINKLIERASLINDDEVKNDILLQIEELKQDYLRELFKSKRAYQRIDFNKTLEEVKTNTGEVKLTFIPLRPVLIKELIEKELAISRRIDREINNNELRNDLDRFDDYVTSIVKR